MIKRAKYTKLTGIALGASLAFTGLAMATAVSTPAKAQAKAEAKTGWVKDCRKSKDGSLDCITAVNIIITKPRKQRLAGVAVLNKGKTKKDTLLIVLPLGAKLQLGYTLIIDKNDPIKGMYSICLRDGCHSQIGANADLIKQMKNGKEIHLIYVNHKRQKINVAVPLIGFTKAYNSKGKAK